MKQSPLKILIAGGGTGGHLFPGISLAEVFREQRPGSDIRFAGTKKGLEYRLLPGKTDFRLYTLPVGGLYKVGFLKRSLSLLKLPLAIFQSIGILLTFRPHLVIGVGGYASGPMLLAALLLRKRTVIQEQNASPGMTNRLLGKWVQLSFIPFGDSKSLFKNPVVVGNPIRKKIRDLINQPDPRSPEDFQLTVFGGSQGARILNHTLVNALPELNKIAPRLKILHQTGKSDYSWVSGAYQKQFPTGEVTPFIEDMSLAYHKSHLLICRAGSSVNEVIAVGRGSVLIPIPYSSGDHQKKNAEVMAKAGASVMLEEKNLSSEVLVEIIRDFLENPQKIQEMEQKAHKLYPGDATSKMVNHTLEYFSL